MRAPVRNVFRACACDSRDFQYISGARPLGRRAFQRPAQCFRRAGPTSARVFRRSVMAIERTLSILKPDTVEKNKIGEVIALIEKAGLKVVAAKLTHLSRPQAEGFY